MELSHKILEQKAVRITPMRQLLLEYFLEQNGTFGLTELETAFQNLIELLCIVPSKHLWKRVLYIVLTTEQVK